MSRTVKLYMVWAVSWVLWMLTRLDDPRAMWGIVAMLGPLYVAMVLLLVWSIFDGRGIRQAPARETARRAADGACTGTVR